MVRRRRFGWLAVPWLWPGLLAPARAQPAKARELKLHVDFIYFNGLLEPAQLAELLAQPDVTVQAGYHPRRLIRGETFERTPALPFGTRDIVISRDVTLRRAEIASTPSSVSFALAERLDGIGDYRLRNANLFIPIPPGLGRPQPHLRVSLFGNLPQTPLRAGALWDFMAFELGGIMSVHWSDEAPPRLWTPRPDDCRGVRQEPDGSWRFEPRHPLAGLWPMLSSMAYQTPRAGSHTVIDRMNGPAPPWLDGYALSRHHLVRAQAGAAVVEFVSVYGERTGPGACSQTILLDALLADGRPIRVQLSSGNRRCATEHSRDARASWLADGSLAEYRDRASGAARVEWSAFQASFPDCRVIGEPSDAAVAALRDQALELAHAFRPR